MSFVWHSCCTVLPNEALDKDEMTVPTDAKRSPEKRDPPKLRIWKGARPQPSKVSDAGESTKPIFRGPYKEQSCIATAPPDSREQLKKHSPSRSTSCRE